MSLNLDQASLLKPCKADNLIFTGGFNPYDSNLPPEGDINIDEALAFEIPKKDLLSTYPVLNTYQEAKAIKNLINKSIPLNKNKIILVTSAFHMKRAKRLFERTGFKVFEFPLQIL